MDLLGAFQLRKQLPRRIRKVGLRLRELAFEQLRRDQRQVDLTSAMADHPFQHLEAGRGLVTHGLLGQEEAERRLGSSIDHAGRRVFQRPLWTSPELEPRPTAGLPNGVSELGALLDERLVDDHEHFFAGLEPPGLDQVPAPALHLVGSIDAQSSQSGIVLRVRPRQG